MTTVSSPAALPKYIETLLSDRSRHVSAIATIDDTLARVSAALGGTAAPKAALVKASAAPAKKPVGRPKAVKAPVAKAPAAKASANGKGGLTANEFVIEFVKSRKNPTSQEINKHWVASGRNGMADNSLSLLTKAKKLKRTPLEGGQRGSRYTVA